MGKGKDKGGKELKKPKQPKKPKVPKPLGE